MSLGKCEKCHGDLCVRGYYGVPNVRDDKGSTGIVCSVCGTPQLNHPMHKELQSTIHKTPTPDTKPIPPQEYAHTAFDRLLALEKLTKAQGQRIAALEATLKSQRKTG